MAKTNSVLDTIGQALNNIFNYNQTGTIQSVAPTTSSKPATTTTTKPTTTTTPKPSVYATPTATPTYVVPTETSHTTSTQRQQNAENFKNAVNAGATIVSSKDAAIYNANQAVNNALGAGLNLGTLTQQPSATTLPTTNTTTTSKPSTTTNKANTNTSSNNVVYDNYDSGEVYVGHPGNYAGVSGGGSSSIYDQINAWYDAQKQAVINQIQHAMDQAIADYEKSIAGLDENYQPLRNQSEVERFKSEQALKEQLANSGNTYSGLGRQEALNLQNAFSNNIVDINNQQQNELEELQRAIQNVTSEGEFQKANAGLTYDANQLQSMIDQANLDREYEWNKYLQQYQEKQDSLAYDWQKYLQDYKESQNAIKGVTSGNSGTSTNTSGSLIKHTATQAKNWLNSSLSSGDVYDGMDEDLDTYYSNYGSYPTDEMMDAFIDQVNEYIGGDGRHKDNYAKSLLTAWYGTGRLNDVQATILGKMFDIEL